MALQGKRKEKGIVTEYDAQLKEIRGQLTDQMKCLDSQVELRSQCLQDLSEFFRRKAEIEVEYSRGLDKLAERFSSKIRNAKEQQGFRKDQKLLSPVNCWYLILEQTRQESKDHVSLSEIYSNNIVLRLSHICEDVSRLSKKAVKTYHMYHLESSIAESKLKEVEKLAEKQMGKSTEQGGGQPGSDNRLQRRSSLRKIEKMKEKRQERYLENQLKCTKARNEYLLNLSVANAAVSSYFIHDVSMLMDCCELGFHSSLGRTLRMYLTAETRVEKSRRAGLNLIGTAIDGLDPQSDKTKVMDLNYNAFCLPHKFDFLPHDQDKVCEVRAVSAVYQELQARFHSLQGSLATAKLETEEINKTVKATLQALQELAANEDLDLPDVFQSSRSTESMKSAGSDSSIKANIGKRRSNQQDTETYYFTKLKEFVTVTGRITKLQAKFEVLKPSVEKGIVEDECRSRLQSTLGRSQRQRRSRPCSQYNQNLFSGDLQLFIKSSGQPIPLVVVSCIRFINLYGLHHEGIFRIPGSQVEVNDIRNAFERGEDPLDMMNEHNIDSVAGVLKLYFRGLSKPIFPTESFIHFITCVETENMLERVQKIKSVVDDLDPSIIIVLRYLFAFLNHLSRYSDENMMDPHNLAVCFGPTLITVPQDQDPVSCQAQVNEAIKTIILYHDKIFPRQEELQGPVYEKCMTEEGDYCASLQSEPVTEECDQDSLLEIHVSEDEAQGSDIRAVAKFDYSARSGKELSLCKGEPLLLFQKVSDDWWTGQSGGVRGLVPHKYIEVTDTTDGLLDVPSDSANEQAPSEEATGSSRLAPLSDSDSDPMLRKRSGSSPVRKISTLFVDGAARIPASQPSPHKMLPTRSNAPDERHSVSVAIQERRNTLDLMQLSHRPDRTAASKLDRQHSEKPASELSKEIVKNMDSVFRELLQCKRLKTSGEEPQDPSKAEGLLGQGVTLRRSSSGALEKPASKQGTPSKPSMKSRAAALFKSSAGGTADGTPKVTS
ncbi:SLIT-ROBO Rho GTPase-activating protein 3-like isoform X2 [Carcharodon carcharias]|uniref:SLIT-ROBO Rho GTPase-activating protein 3-like isoform X2 n=1 Tax=Carcharodon carcharias TaxID=13397 RepID=UPI001B7EECBD|nr:SLIT-ROBO Rho GTPase-activating protein 3-like isoform X2 [Carcharodon carcharias]